jgi:YaiO family outer membrane protein
VRLLIAAALLATIPALAMAQPTSSLEQGEQLRREGRPAQAIPLLEAATRENPQDADAWLNLGLAYAVTDRLDEAEAALDRAHALAPDYADVQIARARAAYFRSNPDEASRRLAPVLAAHPDNAEAQDLARQIAAARASGVAPWRLDLAYTHGSLSDGLPDAYTAFVSLTHRFAGGRAVGLSLDNTRQFGDTDTYGEVTFANRRAYLAIGGAVGADFRPEWAVRGGVYADPATWGDWKAQFLVDGGWARYATGDVRTLTPGLDLSSDRVNARLRWINVLDEADDYRTGYSVQGDWRAAERFSLFAGWADAPASSEGRTVRVKTFSGGVAVDANPNTTVRLGFAHAMRRTYDRDDVTLSVTRRF